MTPTPDASTLDALDPWQGDDASTPTPDSLHAYLTHDVDGTPTGHLRTPCGHGYDADDAAWYAVAYFLAGEDAAPADDPRAALDDAMSRAVNGADGVVELIGRYAYAVPVDVLARLDADALAWRGLDPDDVRRDACAMLDDAVGPPLAYDHAGDRYETWSDYVDDAETLPDLLAPVAAYADDMGEGSAQAIADAALTLDAVLSMVAAVAAPAATGVVPLPGFPLTARGVAR